MNNLKGIIIVGMIAISVMGVLMMTSYKVAHDKGVLEGRLLEIDAKVKLLEKNYEGLLGSKLTETAAKAQLFDKNYFPDAKGGQ